MTIDNLKPKFRVLMTIGRLNIGGAERRLLQLLRYLQHRGAFVEVSFFVISGAEGHLDSAFRAAGARIYYGRPSLVGLIDLISLCKRIKPDLIHANSGSAGGFYCLAGRIGGVKYTVSHIRSCGPLKRPFLSRHALVYEPCTSLFSNAVIGVSAATFENRKFNIRNWRVIHDGIDADEHLVAKESRFPEQYSVEGPNFVILGRLDILKNVAHAIHSFADFVAQGRYTNARLHVIGPEGNQKITDLRIIADERNITQTVFFHGPTDEPMRYLRHADCTLLCSDYEGLPGSALEALACGTPVIASDIGPAREVSSLTYGVKIVPVIDRQGWVRAMELATQMDRVKIERDFWERSPFPLHRHSEALIELWSNLTGKDVLYA